MLLKRRLQIELDKYSIEIFEDGNAMSSTIYPIEGADKLQLKITAKECKLTKYEI